MSYLVIAAHPDDEILGCGGSIKKWSDNGIEVNILILAEGITSRSDHRDRENKKSELSKLAIAAEKAKNISGAKSLQLLDYPDNRMDSIDLLNIVTSPACKIKLLFPTYFSARLTASPKPNGLF